MRATVRLNLPTRRTAAALVVMLVCSAIGLAQTNSEKILVDDVIPQGNRAVPTQKIISLIKTRPGGEYKQDVVDEDVRKLSETHLFANIRVYSQRTPDNKIKVYFLVTEFPSTVQEIEYRGAKHLKADELETITGLHKGAPLNPIANRMAREAILRRYDDMGRIFAGVELLEGDKPGDTRVVFNITEGPVVKVHSIAFTGNTFVGGARLDTQIDSYRSILDIGGTYEPAKVDHDVAKLEEYYRNNGYHDVHVVCERVWGEDPRYIGLVFHVQEGPRYRVAEIQIDGNKSQNGDKLLTNAKLVKGDFYNKAKADADEAAIKNKYGYDGFGVTVREQDFYPGPGLVAVHYEVQERPPSRVADIKIAGNTVTRDNVILRGLGIYPGQILQYPELGLAERKLAAMNIFDGAPDKRPTVTIIDPDGPAEYKDVLVNLHETQTGSLMFGVGVNSDAGLVGTVVLTERNFDITRWPTSLDDFLSGQAFRGAGQEFEIRAMPGTQYQNYSVSWREPSLFDSPWSFGVRGYYNERLFNEYTETRLGAMFTLGRRLNQYWSLTETLRVEQVGVHDVASFEPDIFVNAVGDHFLTGLATTLTRDARNNRFRPTEGSVFNITFEQVFGDFTFPKVQLEGNKFFTIYERPDGSGRQVLAARSLAAWAGSNTPFFERFYAGGFQSMRGFEFRGVSPAIDGYKIGGDFMFLNSLEYQIPILANDNLYGVVFIDSGTVESSLEIKDYRVTAGFGLRIVVPMLGQVPIALDFGFPIVKGPDDREQVFSFWVGFFR
jgi:outer membrane protein insertion porin family